MGFGDGHWKIILTGSHFTSDSESRYSSVEEALFPVYGQESRRMFILECQNLLVTVDHLPLTKIFSDQALENIKNLRLLHFKERMRMSRFQINHHPGKLNIASDCAFRYPAGTARESPTQIFDTAVKAAFTSMYGSDPKLKVITLERFVAAAATDEECQTIANIIQNSFPKLRNDLPSHSSGFLALAWEIILFGKSNKDNKILIPRQLRAEVL